MRIFRCDRCGEVLSFGALTCPACLAAIGYVSDQRTLRALVSTSDPAVFLVDGDGHDWVAPMWRCMNAAYDCNWMLPAHTGDVWCRSCRLTRGRPDVDRPVAIEAWMAAESAKRRLVHQLDQLALPIEIKSESMPNGFLFDLVYLPGEGGLTGHLDGVVTLDLAETDERHRDDLRRRLGEPFRTVIGHLRHEIGHHYWGRLVAQTNDTAAFRQMFGDEREDYSDALARHYAGADERWDRTRFVSAYACSHPLEDWAETFAHYLHILDAIDTAVAHDLVRPETAQVLAGDAVGTLPFTVILDAWRPVNAAVNAIAETVGVRAVYPFEPSGIVIDKLAFVHGQIAAHTRRDRFYSDS